MVQWQMTICFINIVGCTLKVLAKNSNFSILDNILSHHCETVLK